MWQDQGWIYRMLLVGSMGKEIWKQKRWGLIETHVSFCEEGIVEDRIIMHRESSFRVGGDYQSSEGVSEHTCFIWPCSYSSSSR